MKIRMTTVQSMLVVLAIIGFPCVAAIASVLELQSTPISILMRATTLTIALLIIARVSTSNNVRGQSLNLVLLLAFWCAYLARVFIDTVVLQTYLSRPDIDYWLWSIGACLIPTIAAMHLRNESAYEASSSLLFYLTLGVSIVIVVDGSSLYDKGLDELVDIGRLSLTSLNPIAAGHVGVTLLLLSIWGLIFPGKPNPRQLRWYLYLAGLALGLYLLVTAASRGPIVALLLTLLFYLVTTNARRTIKYTPVVLGVLIISYLIASKLESLGEYRLLSRIMIIGTGDDMAVVGRQESFYGAFQQFRESPLIGDSLEEKTTSFYPHNILLEALMATGLVGSIPFMALIYRALASALHLVRTNSRTGWVALLFIQYFVGAQFSGSIYSNTVFWMLLGMLLARGVSTRAHTNQVSDPRPLTP
jgi:O-antigen ligase